MKKLLMIMPAGGLAGEFTGLLSDDFEIVTAESEEEGFKILDDHLEEISAVLVDLKLSRESGFIIINRMNTDKIFASIPVIAISDHAPVEEDMECFDMGFSDLLTPPGLKQHLVRRINSAIRAKDSFTYSEMQKMLKQLPSNIFLKDADGKYVFATQYWNHLKQDGEKHWTIRGKTDLDIRKDKQNAMKAMESDKEILRTGIGTNYIIEENNDGVREFLELIKRPLFDEDGKVTGIIALINNVTETQLLKMELEERSKTDPLTRLLNKGAMEELVRMMLANYHQASDNCALMMIDVDNFKGINDNFGHAAGDHVLATIGRLIHDSFKGMDVEGRIGGDEFMVFLRDIDSAKAEEHLAQKLEDETKRAFDNEDYAGLVTLSIGIAMYPKHGKTFEELYNAADQALYYVKEHGKGSYHMYGTE